MNDACQFFRDEWAQGGADSRHADACASCARWMQSLTRIRSAFTDLGRLAAPAELDQRVADELAGDRSRRQRRALESLVRRGAPAQLDERIAEMLARSGSGAEERGARKAEALRALDVQRAPAVLERLLNEELADPALQRVERFSGGLERLAAPDALAERIGGSVRRRAWLRLWIGPLTALSAAALVVWIALRSEVPETRAYRFQVAHATTLDALDPLARALAESLGGGAQR